MKNQSLITLVTWLLNYSEMRQRTATNYLAPGFSQEIKEFAISLHFYSPRAYKFVRKSLNLPHPATIRSWSVNIECEPGFLKKPFEFVEGKVKEGQKDCVLMLDEMSIKKQLQWDKKQSIFVGNTDYGAICKRGNGTGNGMGNGTGNGTGNGMGNGTGNVSLLQNF